MFKEAVSIMTANLGRKHPDVANACWNWAASLKASGKIAEAKSTWTEACEIFKATLGIANPTTKQCIEWWEES